MSSGGYVYGPGPGGSPSDLQRLLSASYGPWAQLGSLSVSLTTGGSNTPTPEFSGIPFDMAVGEVYGLRVWKVDKYGRLRARHVEIAKPWRPGVNAAVCNAQVAEGEEHDAPGENCRCGFYAYTEMDHVELQFRGAGNGPYILGVIKGSGRTLLGTQGFRCEKAEIVALQNPAGAGEGPKSSAERKLADQIKAAYPDVPLLPTRSALLAFAPVESLLPDPGTEAFWELP